MGIRLSEPNTWTDFAICRDADMTAILLEHAYYSNPHELELLKDNDFRIQCAEVIARTVCEWYDIEYTEDKVTFSDIEGHWAEKNIEEATGAGLMIGYPDGTFRPDETVTRAEFATVLAKLKGD
ncbi:S-layer homology domain-containing protein [Vallitalea okinawensis]|uniref:S-layer homology domain-containing protein n=1 Tax=Vallitalea okinawensis TaxID=2078660 RepID=UPI001FA886E0|nr:S-layer homology domain-containing protein [Vallitalea okinawensis]